MHVCVCVCGHTCCLTQGDVEGEIEIPYVPMTGPDEDETVALADAESRLSSLTMHTASDASAAGLGTSAGSTSRPLEPLGSHFSVPLTETSTSATKVRECLQTHMNCTVWHAHVTPLP